MNSGKMTYESTLELFKAMLTEKLGPDEKTHLIELSGIWTHIDKNNVLKRYKGTTAIKLVEFFQACDKLGLSIDSFRSLSNITEPIIFYKNLDPTEKSIITFRKEFLGSVAFYSEKGNCEYKRSAQTLPASLYNGYPNVAKFYLMRWLYLTRPSELKDPKYYNFEFDNPIIDDREFIYSKYNTFNRLTYLLYDSMIEILIRDVRLFQMIRIISDESIEKLKTDLLRLINHMEQIAVDGYLEKGGVPVRFYACPILPEDLILFDNPDSKKILFAAHHFSVAQTNEPGIFRDTINRFTNYERISRLISMSGTIDRIKFFEKQRSDLEKL